MLTRVLAIANAVIADAARRKVVWVVVVFTAILAIAIPALPSYGEGVASAVFREVSIALMYSAALVVALALAVNRIPVEIERRTVFNVITRDVRRWHYVVGTWLGMFVVLGLVIAAFSAVTIGIGAFTYSELMWRLFQAAFALWLEMGVILAVAVMLSCAYGPVTSAVAALVFAFVGHSVPSLMNLPEGVRVPWYIPGLDVFNVIMPVAHGSGYALAYAASMLIVFTAWVGLLLMAGSAILSRRDM